MSIKVGGLMELLRVWRQSSRLREIVGRRVKVGRWLFASMSGDEAVCVHMRRRT